MTKDSARDSSSTVVQAIIKQALRLAVASLHMTLCGIKADSLGEDKQRNLLAHISYMTSMIAHYSTQVDAATTVPCPRCRDAVERKMSEFEH